MNPVTNSTAVVKSTVGIVIAMTVGGKNTSLNLGLFLSSLVYIRIELRQVRFETFA